MTSNNECTHETNETKIEALSNDSKDGEVDSTMTLVLSAMSPIKDSESKACVASAATTNTISSSTTGAGKRDDEADVEKAKSMMETVNDESSSVAKDGKAVENEEEEVQPSFLRKLINFYKANEFLILILCAICLARAYPPLGADYLAPEITATWCSVIFIFLYAGLGLKTNDFATAFKRVYFNTFVQFFNFGFVSAVVYAGTRGLEAANILSPALSDGMVIASCMPMAINVVHVLTEAAGGDEPLAIINSAGGNMIGVFLSPALILGYLGVTGETQMTDVFYKLTLRVLLPVIVGQIVQKTMHCVMAIFNKYKLYYKKAQEYALVFIVYTVFCETFTTETSSSLGDVFLMIIFVLIFLIFFMITAWFTMGLLFRDYPEMRVMGLFGCTHKTIALGIPLVNALYEGNPNVGLYTLPLLIWHPMQLIIGSLLVKRLKKFVDEDKIRLGRADEPSSTVSTDKGIRHITTAASSDLESPNSTCHSNKTETIRDEPTEDYAV
ncbi:hypothetical protein ACA910_006925 [Epithemia clementina (nom. ined.)]